jgi:hypothetical protein
VVFTQSLHKRSTLKLEKVSLNRLIFNQACNLNRLYYVINSVIKWPALTNASKMEDPKQHMGTCKETWIIQGHSTETIKLQLHNGVRIPHHGVQLSIQAQGSFFHRHIRKKNTSTQQKKMLRFTIIQCQNLVLCKIIFLYNLISFLFCVTCLIFKTFKTEFQKIS